MSQRAELQTTPPQDDYTLIEHLTELRNRIVYSLYAIVAFTAAGWYFSDKIFGYVRRPIQPYLEAMGVKGLVFMAPTEEFMAHVKIAIVTGIVAACPVWIYQIWRFVEPGLYSKEKKYGRSFIFFGTVLFLTGVSFAYFVVMPAAFKVLLSFGGGVDVPMISIEEYLSFFIMTILVFGAAFEMPLIIVILGLMGIVTTAGLRRTRRYAYVAIAVVAGVFTPPDAISMMLLGIPLTLLYEISILVLKIFEPKPFKV